MTDAELNAKNRALTSEALLYGYHQTQHWLDVSERELAEAKLRYLPAQPDLYDSRTYSTQKQAADLRRELAAYEREFHRRGLPLTTRELSPQAA